MENLKELIDRLNTTDECSDIEAKRASEVGKSIMETACAYSNEPQLGGGYLLLGVEKEDQTTSLFPEYTVTGIPQDKLDQVQTDISTQASAMFNRPVRPRINVETVNGKSAIVVFVDELSDEHRIDYLKANPQNFTEQCIEIINRQKELLMVDGIEYQRIGSDSFYKQNRIENETLTTYLKNELVVDSTKSPYSKTICDSKVESSLAKEFEDSLDVKLYAKLPGWFTVPTPLGTYNPDWAIVYEKDNREKLYFITESKGTIFDEDLRPTEKGKIQCGEKHFESMDSRLILAHKLKDVMDKV